MDWDKIGTIALGILIVIILLAGAIAVGAMISNVVNLHNNTFDVSCVDPGYHGLVTDVVKLDNSYLATEVETGRELHLPMNGCVLTEIEQ